MVMNLESDELGQNLRGFHLKSQFKSLDEISGSSLHLISFCVP
jgi:hypothetical protein